MRTFDVLVEQTINRWVTVEAEDASDAQQKILQLAIEIPNQREARYAVQALPRDPTTKHGRVLVLDAVMVCGPTKKMLLRLDCGHTTYIAEELWFPENPYAECTNTTCRTRKEAPAK